jgi:hypothetical protein
MTSEDVGQRSADGAYEWTVGEVEGKPLMIRHWAPDAVSHLYPPSEINEPTLLHGGRFIARAGPNSPEHDCDGDIRLSWRPTPRIEVRGEYDPGPEHIEALLSGGADTIIWYTRLQIRLPDSPGVPDPPTEEAPAWSRARQSAYLGPAAIYPPEIGDGAVLTTVTGLIVNGWDGLGSRIADPSDRRETWFGRATAHGGGWLLEMDSLNPALGQLDRLRHLGGYGVTHTVDLSRSDGSPFSAEEATEALDAVRSAFSLILGRRGDVVLPVGWKDDAPVWARWTAGLVDSFSEPGTWLDQSVGGAQVGEVIGRFLEGWSDPLSSDTLRYATSYYVQALAPGAELGTAAAVSGLLLLAYSWLVEDKQRHTRTTWNRMPAEQQIRQLLNECRIDPAIPDAFANLAAVAEQLQADAQPGHPVRDGLGCIIKMRNDVVHPTRSKRLKWSYYEWAEAHSLAVHFLELALLAYVGYRGQYHPRISANRWLGYVEDVPWT